VVYLLFSYHQKNLGGPGSSRGTLEHIRAGLTLSAQGKPLLVRHSHESVLLNLLVSFAITDSLKLLFP
jgi:hypothetical protein